MDPKDGGSGVPHINAGLLNAPSGARAEEWLEWRKKVSGWGEDERRGLVSVVVVDEQVARAP